MLGKLWMENIGNHRETLDGQHRRQLGNSGWDRLATVRQLWIGNIGDARKTVNGKHWQP